MMELPKRPRARDLPTFTVLLGMSQRHWQSHYPATLAAVGIKFGTFNVGPDTWAAKFQPNRRALTALPRTSGQSRCSLGT